MLGLGFDMSKQYVGGPSLTDWTVTTLGGITTPQSALSGTARSTTLTAYVDEANDWTGTLNDYDIKNLVIYNVTDDVTSNQGNLKFNLDAGALVTVHAMSKTGVNCQTLVSAASGKTIRFTFTLALSGYNDVELVSEITY